MQLMLGKFLQRKWPLRPKGPLGLQMALLVLSVVSPQGTGGSGEGDPAPGRSPGPPEFGLKTTEVSRDPSNESNWCRSHFFLAKSVQLNVTLYHPLFDVLSGLFPGILYQVIVRPVGEEQLFEEIFASSTSNGRPFGSWIKGPTKTCLDGKWTPVDLNEPLGWSFHAVEQANITFRFRYRLTSGKIQEENFTYSAVADCEVRLRHTKGSFVSFDLPRFDTCKVTFPRKVAESSDHKDGLLIELTRLNVPCAGGGFIQFLEDSEDRNEEPFNTPKKLCGKLEELSPVERKLYFPSLSETNRPFLLVHKNPVFALSYHLVDYCYNVTFVSRNGSLVLNPVTNLLCHFRVHLSYGNRVLLRLQMGDDRLISTTQIYDTQKSNVTNVPKHSGEVLSWAGREEEKEDEEKECNGLSVIIWDGSLTWTHCSKSGDPKRDIQVWSRENVVAIKISVRTAEGEQVQFPVVKFWYHAEPVSDIVGTCDFGEVAVKQFCVSAVKLKLDWETAEEFCGKRGGHLASIRDEESQSTVDNYLLNSPDYREHNSYWIGASDKIYEGHFRWSDGFPFSYSNWFPGWSQQGFYNRQPNDDGFSHQDCVEIRRVFPHPSGARIVDGVTSSYLWNDLDCSTKNFFLCERLEIGESSEQSWNQECNKTITLSREHPKATVVSSGFPHQYPDNIRCETIVSAPPGFRLIIEFEELVLEKEPSCSYDYLELIEYSRNDSYVARRLCGDMSDKLKLLRYISEGPRLKFVFVSDYSHHYGGFKARVSIESAGMECSDERYQMFNHSCYLFVGYPKVTWETARQICAGMKAELASVLNTEEESFITGNIRNSLEYTTSSAYWLGGYADASNGWMWTDGAPMEYSAWMSNEETDFLLKGEDSQCLAIQWVSSRTEKGHPASGLYWTSQQCKKIGGYVCKKGNQIPGTKLNLNKTINGTEGHLTSLGYPSPYFHNLDYYIHLVGPAWTRMIVTLSKLDLENQAECLYDFIELRSGGSEEAEVRWCGNKVTRKNKSHFVSHNNEAILRFHSDYSVAGVGFYANWKAVDVTGCPLQKLTAREGIIFSPNYGNFLLPRLDCTTIILAPPGKRVWLEFIEVNLKDGAKDKEATLELDLGGKTQSFEPFPSEGSLKEGSFISASEKMLVRLTTSNNPKGRGFRAVYRTVSLVQEEEILDLTSETHGVIHHLNYPADPPPNVDFVQHLIAPIGYIIYLELQEVTLSETNKYCPDGSGIIEVTDNYADVNGTWWFLCEVKGNLYFPTPPFVIASYLNTLHVRQRSGPFGIRMNATVKVKPDPNFKLKLLRAPEGGLVESCRPNPCQNGGKCLISDSKKMCQCIGHFTGMFCALTLCELEPCLFGQCELTGDGYLCHCQAGYTGHSCDKKQSPCEDNPCEGRGECLEKGNSFHCRCHAWWEGPRCEKRMVHIPFKPLSERMLHEPFWLGLITVFVVLGIIGIVWCAKRHFPEKLEKLLAEEADRHSRSNVSGIIRPPSVREQIHSTSASVTVTNPPGTVNCPRTLFGRLGIRKSSLLSLTSPQRQDAGTSRTFSLDDLLRPSPRRTPSPRKKSSSSSSTKRNPAEKKQILQQLICPPTLQPSSPKVTLNELITLNETKRKSHPVEKLDWKETTFTSLPVKADSKTDLSKLEKKVTFARLLNKVSAEMSSGSEPETSNPTLKALSTPVSPALDRKSSHSISSNQGSDSLSSSEIAISGSAFNSMVDIPSNAKRPTRLSYKNAKNASADSILEMFRSFTSASSISRRGLSASTTPTTSPQDEREESSAAETPVSTTSGPVDSPTIYSTTIEIPVLDALTAQKSSGNFLQPPTILLEMPSAGINKCLTPIREVPTPIPSPALTPILPRAEHKAVKVGVETSDEDKCESDESEVLIQVHRDGGGDREEDLIECETFSSEPQPNEAQGMVIPLLTVQEPSPPSTSPPGLFSGSSPPQEDMQSFIFSPGGSPRRFVKGLEKPNSLDLPYTPPMITITCNVSEPESDMEPISPGLKNQTLNPTVNSAGMTYLSPFSMCSRADRTASESNLSSSGYSSMTSPGPSRCGSNNPLCLSEVEDHHQTQSQPPSRRPSPLLRTSSNESHQENKQKHQRGRSDSETLSDDPLMESNDEGIGTDHLDEKIEEGEVKSARELEVFMGKEVNGQSVIDFSAVIIPNAPQRVFKKYDNLECLGSPLSKTSLQLPTIVVQSDYCDKLLSPVSSRSESPLSDKALGRFSPMFYGKTKCDHVIFTDSDGLYDFPSSDCPPSNNKCVQAGANSHRKSTGRRRERRSAYRLATSGSKNSSPTKAQNGLLEVPQKETAGHRRKPSPKRRVRTQHPLSSSSSTESLNSGDGDTWREKTLPGSNEASAEDTAEEIFKAVMESQKDEPFPQRKTVGFRTIGHQIRFLRRIELSLKRKEKLSACLDSEDDGDVDDPSLSLLPQDLRKSSGIGMLQSSVGKHRGNKKRNVAILPACVAPKQDTFSVVHRQTE